MFIETAESGGSWQTLWIMVNGRIYGTSCISK